MRLGVNIDHVATLRQARGGTYPDPVQAAVMAELGGADNITVHLREDRRHIQARDVFLLKETIKIPLNFEMACTAEMIKIAKNLTPHAVTLVPEKRAERTTEGGLHLKSSYKALAKAVPALQDSGIAVSLFIEPSHEAIEMTAKLGAIAVEFHTGRWSIEMQKSITTKQKFSHTEKLINAALYAESFGIQVHLGHGIDYSNANWLQLVNAEEANIGHAIVGRSVFVGLHHAVREMKTLITDRSLAPRPVGSLSSVKSSKKTSKSPKA
jgi:pyridoxine 5-phosphate synthase